MSLNLSVYSIGALEMDIVLESQSPAKRLAQSKDLPLLQSLT